ncbi:MAG: hypothetical protein OXI17_07285 [Gammaproteobacteria bacterium]|nr:hypothetical protein [Gammaproteobacteria bacterium]
MSQLRVESLNFTFESFVNADKYDEWQHVNMDWADRADKKKMDIVAVEPIPSVRTLWMIEVKDFRIVTDPPKPSNLSGLPQTVAKKAEDTLLGLADASRNTQVSSERQLSSQSQACGTTRIVLHLEPHPPSGPRSALFPRGFPASVHQQMKQLVAHIDSNPLVLNCSNTPQVGVPWTVI